MCKKNLNVIFFLMQIEANFLFLFLFFDTTVKLYYPTNKKVQPLIGLESRPGRSELFESHVMEPIIWNHSTIGRHAIFLRLGKTITGYSVRNWRENDH